MKALLCKRHGPPEALEIDNLPDPTPGDWDVVIEVHGAAVNFPDTLIIQNLYQFKPDLPFSPGGECAGIVKAKGSKVGHLNIGDRVLAFTGWGGFAEQAVADSRAVVPMPEGLDFVTASAFVMTYATSYHALADRAAIQSGETLLVLGASGGVGIAAIEIGKALGARVIAAASTAEKLKVCQEHGADDVINYVDEDLKTRIRELTDGKGADVIYDPVGGAFSEAALRAIAWRGRFLVIGFANGEIPKIPLNLALLKGCNINGVFWGDYAKREPMNNMKDLRTLFGWLQAGKLRPHIAGTYSLTEAPKAIRALMDRQVSGKLVITPQEA
ncbi:MAG: NADPH:quinone oxidoreductase family protein [Abyssibacter sp.]|uniref:NADPH:quinone oxidoreductase family protein n=1 Tax=Abyssibacter sp. TaxID=2320200 RepID=UPI00321ACFA0